MSKPLIRARWITAVFVLALFSRQPAVAQTSSPASAEAGDTKAVDSATPNAPTEPSGQQASAVQPPAPQTGLQAIAARPATSAPLGPTGQVNKWLSLRGEFRGRLEGFSGGAYKPDNSDGYLLDRFRIDATVAPITRAKLIVQLQDARAFDKTTGGTAVPLRDTLDLRLAYGEIGGARNMVRAGRQELVFGEQRLIGHLNWVNDARSFDGVRATIARKAFKFDAFATSVVTIQADAFDQSGDGNRLYGFYGSSTTWLPRATVEPYVFYRQSEGLTLETGGIGDINQTTLGARVAGKLRRDVDYGIEMAAQTGSVATDAVHAWAGHWVTGKTFDKTPSKPRPFIEFNYASGDRDPKDGMRGTFDQLYPTGHDKLGLADQVAWKNVRHLRGGIELKPTTQWLLSGSYHSFWLASATDALYGANGAAVARSAAGTAGRFVGHELDAQTVFTYSPQLQIAGGYGHVLPGEFLKNTTRGESYSVSYLMVTYVFMGGRPAMAR